MIIKHKMTYSDKLRVILDVKKWKQKDLVGKLGASEKTISIWINGKKRPSSQNEKKIDDLYRNITNTFNVDSSFYGVVQDYQSKVEINEEEKVFTDTERNYYDAKSYVKKMEKNNVRYVYLFPSISKVEDAWYKVGGNSLLLYKSVLAPRLSREAKLRDDTDRIHRFNTGIVSVKWGNKLMAEAEELGYKANRIEHGIIVIDLMKDYSETEMHTMRNRIREERGRVKKMVRPKHNYPEIMMAMNDLVRVLPSKIKKLDNSYRGIMSEELLEPMAELLKIYFRFANGRMEKRDAKLEMLERVDDLAAMIYLMDECQMLNITARTALGENVVKIRNTIEKML